MSASELQALVIGEALIDIVGAGDAAVEHVGGSPANVAVGLARLGIQTHLLTQIGRDARGRAIEEHLRQAGVELVESSWTNSPTSTAQATLTADGSAHYDFSVRWHKPATFGEPTDIVHAGSIALFIQPGGDALIEHLRSIADSTVVTIDPNIRPALIGTVDLALPRFESLVQSAHVVKMSDEDAEWLYPGRSPKQVLERVGELGVRSAFITRGADGAIGALDGRHFEVDAFPVEVVDTIGAGDAFMSALIRAAVVDDQFWSLEGARRAAIEGAAAAALTVGVAGASPPTRQRIADLIAGR